MSWAKISLLLAIIALIHVVVIYGCVYADEDEMSRQEELDAYRLAHPNTIPITLEKEIKLENITFAYPNTEKTDKALRRRLN